MPDVENVLAKHHGLRPHDVQRPPSNCRVCRGSEISLYVEIPAVAPSPQFIATSRDEAPTSGSTLSVWKCEQCGLIQHNAPYPEAYYQDYLISYETSQFARDYQNKLANEFVVEYRLAGKLVAEIGSGDGIFLAALRDSGAQVIAFERSNRAAEYSRAKGFTVIEGDLFSSKDKLPNVLSAVASRHVAEHIEDLNSFLIGIRDTLEPGGAIFLEVPSVEKTVENHRIYDFIPEHVSYFSAITLSLALDKAGFGSISARRIVEGEFLVVTATKPLRDFPPSEWIGSIANSFNAYSLEQETAGLSVALWGAGPKALGLINEVNGERIRFVVDSDPMKYGRFTPTPRISIISPTQFMADPSDVIVVTAWTYRHEIAQQLEDLNFQGKVVWLGPEGKISSIQ